MLNEPTGAARTLPRDELGRAVIALPADATIYGGTQYIAVVWDHWTTSLVGGIVTCRPSILGNAENSLPHLADYRLIGLLCGDRAKCTVDGELTVHGHKLSPEEYLGMWRHALKHPISPDELAARHRMRILVTLGAALEPARAARCGWSDSPLPTFAEFEAAYGHRFMLSDAGEGGQRFELDLDLREADAARDAFYAHSLLADRKDAARTVRVSLAPTREAVGAPRQALMFEGSLP